jgi:hypothetical protein
MRKPFAVTVKSISFVLLHLTCLAASWLRIVRDIRPFPTSARS